MPVLHATNDERIYRAQSSTRTARQTGSDRFERPRSAAVLAPLPYINVREGQKVTRDCCDLTEVWSLVDERTNPFQLPLHWQLSGAWNRVTCLMFALRVSTTSTSLSATLTGPPGVRIHIV